MTFATPKKKRSTGCDLTIGSDLPDFCEDEMDTLSASLGYNDEPGHYPDKKRLRSGVPMLSDGKKESPKGGSPSKTDPAVGLKTSPFGKTRRAKDVLVVKVCGGCGRSQDDCDWIDPTSKVQWALGHGRGQWCSACHATWRTCFQHATSLNFLPQWLAAGNMESFQQHLIAYVSLVVEAKKDKLTFGMIHDRMVSFKWYHEFMCMSPRANVVVPLAEFLEVCSAWDTKSLSSDQLVTLAGKDGDTLAVCARREQTPGGSLQVERPIAEGQLMPFSDKKYVMVSPADVPLLTHFAKEVKVTSSALSSCTAIVPVNHKDGSSPAPKSRIARRLEEHVSKCKDIFAQFGTDRWETVIESSLTKHAQQLSYLQTECGQAGEDAEVVHRVNAYVGGISSGKLFLRRFRDYGKCRHKVPKLLDCTKPLADIIELLRSDGVQSCTWYGEAPP